MTFFANYKALPWDGIPWEFSSDDRKVFAIGDVHGDFDALVTILIGLKLINERGEWIGGKTFLTIAGDSSEKGTETRACLEFIMRLEKLAKAAGSEVQFIFGNHEYGLSRGRTKHVSDTDVENFAVADRSAVSQLFRADGRYGHWLAPKNSIIKVDRIGFVHAGLRGWAQKFTGGEINATLRAWVRHVAGTGPEPPAKTQWVTGQANLDLGFARKDGPLRTRAFALNLDVFPAEVQRSAQLTDAELDGILSALGVDYLVVGHNAVNEIILDHPRFGKRVVMIDTGISKVMGGQLSALEIVDGEPKPHYFERKTAPVELRTTETARVRGITCLEQVTKSIQSL